MSVWKNVQRYYYNNLNYSRSGITKFQLRRKYHIISKFIMKQFKGQKGLTALDIGCHTGKFVYMLSKLGFKTTGIDTSLPAILTAKRTYDHPNISYAYMSTSNMGFKEKSFNLILVVELLHHFPDDVARDVFVDILTLLKDSGVVVFDVKNKLNPYLWYVYRRNDTPELPHKARLVWWYKKLLRNLVSS